MADNGDAFYFQRRTAFFRLFELLDKLDEPTLEAFIDLFDRDETTAQRALALLKELRNG